MLSKEEAAEIERQRLSYDSPNIVPAKMPADLFNAPPEYVEAKIPIRGYIQRSDIITLDNGDVYVKIGAKVKRKQTAKYSIYLEIDDKLRNIIIPKGMKTKWHPTPDKDIRLIDLIAITSIEREEDYDPIREI